MPIDIKNDRLPDVSAMAAFWGVDKQRMRYLIRRNIVPAGREGNLIIGSKAQLRERYREMFGAEIPEPDTAATLP